MATELIVFALEREAAPFRRLAPSARVMVTGVGRAAARGATARALAEKVPSIVIVAGFCGALGAGLKVGEVLRFAEVVDEDGGVWTCEDGVGRLLTVNRLIGDPAEKAALAKRHVALAVDMESAGVAEACDAAGVPFQAIRAVSDAAETRLSPALVRLLDGGHVSPWRAALALMRSPALSVEFWQLARDTRLAARNLARVLVGPAVPDSAR